MEKTIDRKNYLLTREFLTQLTKRVSKKSVERYRFHLRHLLLWAMDNHLSKAKKIEPDFASYVANIIPPLGGTLARESQKKIFILAHRFFEWAKMNYPKEFNGIDSTWIETLSISKAAIKQSPNNTVDLKLLLDDSDTPDTNLEFVTLEEVITLANLPKAEDDLANWRDCAMAAFLYLTAARATAAVTIPIGAVHFDKGKIRQWPNLGVKTKNGKIATTFMHNIPELIEVAQSWDIFVRTKLPLTSPWYAPIENHWGDQQLSSNPVGENRGVGLNKRLRILYSKVGLPYKSAHAFRHGHAVYELMKCRSMADYKALSLNMMHDSLEITDRIYVHMRNKDVSDKSIPLLHKQILNPAGI